MSAEENKAIIQRYFDEVVNGQNLDVLDELVAEDVVRTASRASGTSRSVGSPSCPTAATSWWT